MRFSPWIACRWYVAASSAATRWVFLSGDVQHISHVEGPGGNLQAVGLEEGEGDALEAEAHAGAVGDDAIVGSDVEHLAEVVEVVVRGSDGGRLLLGADG